MYTQSLNIERRESGPAHRDATSDEYFILPGEIDAACLRHAERFDTCDLLETLQETDLAGLLAALKAGDAKAAGHMMVTLYAERIGDLAAWSLAA
jgi:hypothetical protein